MTLADETWIVTGASRGIGEAIARGLAGHGARLVLNARNVAAVNALADELDTETRVAAGDIGDASTSDRIHSWAHELGGPLGVIHNAAVASPGPMLWELDPVHAHQVLGTNVEGALHLVRALVPQMRTDGSGTLVFVGSGVADRNMAGMGAYCIAKAALEHLARQVALEAPELVSFVWRPGVVDTDMQTEARDAPDAVAAPFQAFRDRGMLVTPAQSADHLVDQLAGDRTALSGTTQSAM